MFFRKIFAFVQDKSNRPLLLVLLLFIGALIYFMYALGFIKPFSLGSSAKPAEEREEKPTATPEPTGKPEPTEEEEPTPTKRLLVPTSKPAATKVPTQIPTKTPTPTVTPSLIPTVPTATPSVTLVPTEAGVTSAESPTPILTPSVTP
jgi:hypothetical protein